jgi:NAD(P)H-dependent flavin oxidoreductase YrpB (nitropropane dioxygenase family)
MNVAAGPDLAAAVTNAGGLGVVGGLGYTPEYMRKQIHVRHVPERFLHSFADF